MWHKYPFIQRNRTTERRVSWGLEVTGKWGKGGIGQNFKKGGR